MTTPAPKFCSQCGAPLAPDARFCNQCGTQVKAALPPTPHAVSPLPPAAQPAAASYGPAVPPVEPILTVVALVQRAKGLLGLGRDSFSLIVTPGRSIFVPVTEAQKAQAVRAAREGAKQQGKGWLGQSAAQMGWISAITQSYQRVPVEALLAQTPGCFFFPLQMIRRITLEVADDEESGGVPQERMILHTTSGKQRFELSGVTAHDAANQLRSVLGQLIRY